MVREHDEEEGICFFVINRVILMTFWTRVTKEPTLLDTCAQGGGNCIWVQIECGRAHMVALSYKGEVYTWGQNYSGQLGHGDEEERFVPTKIKSLEGISIVKVSCGAYHTAALADTGELFTWYVPWFVWKLILLRNRRIAERLFFKQQGRPLR